MKKLVFLLTFLVGSFAFGSAFAEINQKFIGTWDYKVPTAPYEYSTGQLIIDDVDGELTVKVKLMDDTEIQAEQVKLEENKLSFGVMVDYQLVNLNLEIKEGKLVGKVQGPEGPMDFTATKKD